MRLFSRWWLIMWADSMMVVRTASYAEVVYPEHVDPVIPRMSMQECVDAVHEHLQYCSSLGLTQLEDEIRGGRDPSGARLYTEMRRQKGLPCHLTLNCGYRRVSHMSAVGDGVRGEMRFETRRQSRCFPTAASDRPVRLMLEDYENPVGTLEASACKLTRRKSWTSW